MLNLTAETIISASCKISKTIPSPTNSLQNTSLPKTRKTENLRATSCSLLLVSKFWSEILHFVPTCSHRITCTTFVWICCDMPSEVPNLFFLTRNRILIFATKFMQDSSSSSSSFSWRVRKRSWMQEVQLFVSLFFHLNFWAYSQRHVISVFSFFFFFPIFSCCSKSGDQPQGNLAKSGYRENRQVKKSRNFRSCRRTNRN